MPSTVTCFDHRKQNRDLLPYPHQILIATHQFHSIVFTFASSSSSAVLLHFFATKIGTSFCLVTSNSYAYSMRWWWSKFTHFVPSSWSHELNLFIWNWKAHTSHKRKLYNRKINRCESHTSHSHIVAVHTHPIHWRSSSASADSVFIIIYRWKTVKSKMSNGMVYRNVCTNDIMSAFIIHKNVYSFFAFNVCALPAHCCVPNRFIYIFINSVIEHERASGRAPSTNRDNV